MQDDIEVTYTRVFECSNCLFINEETGPWALCNRCHIQPDKGFKEFLARRGSTSVWYKPWTWGTGGWIPKKGDRLTQPDIAAYLEPSWVNRDGVTNVQTWSDMCLRYMYDSSVMDNLRYGNKRN